MNCERNKLQRVGSDFPVVNEFLVSVQFCFTCSWSRREPAYKLCVSRRMVISSGTRPNSAKNTMIANSHSFLFDRLPRSFPKTRTFLDDVPSPNQSAILELLS